MKTITTVGPFEYEGVKHNAGQKVQVDDQTYDWYVAATLDSRAAAIEKVEAKRQELGLGSAVVDKKSAPGT